MPRFERRGSPGAAPVFLWDASAGELLAFDSAADAARHLEPWQEVGALAAYDAEGRRVAFGVERRRVRFLGVISFEREVVVVKEVEASPAHAVDLRRALVAELARRGADRASLEALPLAELVLRAMAPPA